MDELPDDIDIRPRRPVRRFRLAIILLILAVFFGAGTFASYYVEALWFGSLGYGDVFWRTLNVQSLVFITFALLTWFTLYGAFVALQPPHFGTLTSGGIIIVNGRPVRVPVGPVLRVIALVGSTIVAFASASAMASDWSTFALWWYGSGAPVPSGAITADPILGRPIPFYLFTLPVWESIAGWLTLIAVLVFAMALFFRIVTGAAGAVPSRRLRPIEPPSTRGLSLAWAFLLLTIAAQVYLGRFDHLFEGHTIFTGVTYTDAHVSLPGALAVAVALAAGGLFAAVVAFVSPKVRWIVAAVVPAAVLFLGCEVVGAYVAAFVVKPNELVRETPYIAHNIAFTRQAFGLDRMSVRSFPAEPNVAAADPEHNQDTLRNIRLWDWRALQDTLTQLQAIRTYYEFADVDIDRYRIDGVERQVMLAARELSLDKLPTSSRNWINEKLIYTHGYGLTMNPVNGFTPEGLPDLLLRDMPVQSTVPSLTLTRPEIYFGERTASDVYVKTRQREFNYPQGQTNNLTSYEGSGGIAIGGFFRRLLIALDRGDLTKLPFSDDVTADSRLLMRRTLGERVAAIAPFLSLDEDPYVVLGDEGRLWWMMDGFTTSPRYPYSRFFTLDRARVNYARNSVKIVIDAYNGTVSFYVFDTTDPVIAAWRRVFPSLFKDAAEMPAGLRRHVRYPEMLLALQAEVFGLYHMTTPEVFYNREDLWTVASEVASNNQADQSAQPMEPNFVVMTLPGESSTEFVEVLPFTPANRNNLIGWIAGRSDGAHYGDAVIYEFPKTRLVDGPLQVEARIDQNAQLSAQMSLWNQQGSRVRRGALLVIPIGRALLYAEPIYLQAERSPMPELRLVVLAMQDRLAYAPTFEGALADLFGQPPPATPQAAAAAPSSTAAAAATPPAADVDALVAQAARDLEDYQRLTAEGKLGDAGQKLEHLKQTLEALRARQR